jgi:hypothetical protein
VNSSLHDFHNGFIPEADLKDDHIIVTRNSPLISAVSRKTTRRVSDLGWILYRRRRES